MRFALSTSWNAQSHEEGPAIVSEIRALGFDKIELNFTLSQKIVDSISGLQKDGLIKVVGLHNFCPIPEGLPRSQASPDCYSLSSLDEEERRRAILQTQRTIDTARELGAEVVVLHAGKVDMDQNPKALVSFYKRGKPTRFYEMAKKNLLEERSQRSEKFLAAAIRSLEELATYSLKAGLNLGIETRYYPHEIPSLDEIEAILDHFEGSSIFYWHDTGHAQVQENLGFARHRDYLDRFGTRMIGVHLHDVVGVDDHRAPGDGELDFGMLAPYLKDETLLVLEPHPPTTGRQIRKAVNYLRGRFSLT